jgi:hypothetical protein
MPRLERLMVVAALAFAAAAVAAPSTRAGTGHGSAGQEGSKTETSEPVSGNVDRVVPYPLERVLEAARQAMESHDVTIKKDEPGLLEGTRKRFNKPGNEGGEKITVKLSTQAEGTRVVIRTGLGFRGRLNKSNWSTPIFKEMVRLLELGIV